MSRPGACAARGRTPGASERIHNHTYISFDWLENKFRLNLSGHISTACWRVRTSCPFSYSTTGLPLDTSMK